MNSDFLVDLLFSLYQGTQIFILFSGYILSYIVNTSRIKFQQWDMINRSKSEINNVLPGSLDRMEDLKENLFQKCKMIYPYCLPVVNIAEKVTTKFVIHWKWWKSGGSIPFATDDKEEVPDGETEESNRAVSKNIVIAIQLFMRSKFESPDWSFDNSDKMKASTKKLLKDPWAIKLLIFYFVHRLWDLLFGFQWSRSL